MPIPRSPFTRRHAFVALAAAALALATLAPVALAQADHSGMDHARHEDRPDADRSTFAEREAEVMPFDLEASMHVFEDTATGGVQRVIVRDADDAVNVASIRAHLRQEAEAFANGDFDDPAYLHGESMPGLDELRAAGSDGRLKVRYEDEDAGGRIVYRSDDPRVVIAVHLWFQAQVIDHGDHASY